MRSLFVIFCLVIGFHAAAQGLARPVRVSRDFKRMINSPQKPADQLEWGGVFEKTDLTDPALSTQWRREHPRHNKMTPYSVAFFKNGVATFSYSTSDSGDLSTGLTAPRNLEKCRSFFFWGTFEIRHDTVNAIFFINYSDANARLFAGFNGVYYRGIIKDRNTIADWRPIAPFPRDRIGNGPTKKPMILVYEPFPDKCQVDCTRAWVNKYREN